MRKIEELEGYGGGKELATKLNEVIQVVNNLKGVEKEVPIYETLAPNESYIVSKDEEGVLVATNISGAVHLKRVPYPKEEEIK